MNSVYRTTALWESLDDTLADMDGVRPPFSEQSLSFQVSRHTSLINVCSARHIFVKPGDWQESCGEGETAVR